MNKGFFNLSTKLVLSAVLSLTIAVFAGCVIHTAGKRVIVNTVESSAFKDRETKRVLNKIQNFIDTNELTVAQVGHLSKSYTHNDLYLLVLYIGDTIIYDNMGMWSGMRMSEIMDAPAQGYSLKFADDTVSVVLNSDYTLRYYEILNVGCIVFSALLFIFLYSGLIRRRIRYIVKLEKEMRMLEGGDLQYEVSVEGADELSALAKSINDMRLTTIERQEGEARAMKAGRDLIASLSHDLRTPLTALIGYLELLSSGHYKDEEHLRHFIESGLAKAYRINEMTNALFQYAVNTVENENLVQGELMDAGLLLRQLLDEYQLDLSNAGFVVKCPKENIEAQIKAVSDEIARVFDNIISNIRKYASKDEPVDINWEVSDGMINISFKNRIRTSEQIKDGTGLGIENCKRILARHGGEFHSENDSKYFHVHICLPVHDDTADM